MGTKKGKRVEEIKKIPEIPRPQDLIWTHPSPAATFYGIVQLKESRIP